MVLVKILFGLFFPNLYNLDETLEGIPIEIIYINEIEISDITTIIAKTPTVQ
jgi:hypothetical protein